MRAGVVVLGWVVLLAGCVAEADDPGRREPDPIGPTIERVPVAHSFDFTGACVRAVDRCPGPYLQPEPLVLRLQGYLREVDLEVTGDALPGSGPVIVTVSVGSWSATECGAGACARQWHGREVARAEGSPPFSLQTQVVHDAPEGEVRLELQAPSANQTSFFLVRDGSVAGHLLVERMPDAAPDDGARGDGAEVAAWRRYAPTAISRSVTL